MISLRNISIRNKLILMQVFTSVIVLSAFLIAFIITDIRNYKERRVKSLTSIAHMVGLNNAAAIDFQQPDEAAMFLAGLSDIVPELVYADIKDINGKTFASYQNPRADSLAIPKVNSDEAYIFKGNQLQVTDNIISNNELIGKVSLQIELLELAAAKKAKYTMAIILMLASVCFSFIIAFAVQPYISKRLMYLVNIMKKERVSGENTIMIADDGKDEISTLIRAYNMLMLQIKESQQRKDEFIGIASHELKTPLTSIKGYLDLLNSMVNEEPNKQFVSKALESTHKLEKLIRDLLDVSKIQSGQLQLNITEFNMDDLIDETIASTQMVSTAHQIIREDDLNDLIMYADRQKIEQVLINLLSNAIKYSPAGNKVVIRSKINNTELIIQVRDYGIGISEEEIPEIFERFYRTKGSSIHVPGFGLGLYICRDIIRRHKGRIWIEREAKGSSFYFSLPITATEKITEPQNIQNAGLAI